MIGDNGTRLGGGDGGKRAIPIVSVERVVHLLTPVTTNGEDVEVAIQVIVGPKSSLARGAWEIERLAAGEAERAVAIVEVQLVRAGGSSVLIDEEIQVPVVVEVTRRTGP